MTKTELLRQQREQRRQEKLKAERERLEGMRVYERQYRERGTLCGIDEVGRGPLAGPVVAGAVILPEDCEILYLNDSKKLSEKKRELLYDEIMEKAIAVGIGEVSPERIDEIKPTISTRISTIQPIRILRFQISFFRRFSLRILLRLANSRLFSSSVIAFHPLFSFVTVFIPSDISSCADYTIFDIKRQ